MRITTFGAAIGAGAALAIAAIPAAQAMEVDASHQSTTALSAQTLKALEARWKAEAAGEKILAARAQAARTLKARGWTTESKFYG